MRSSAQFRAWNRVDKMEATILFFFRSGIYERRERRVEERGRGSYREREAARLWIMIFGSIRCIFVPGRTRRNACDV